MIEIFLAEGFQLSLGRLENWTCVYYFINEPLNPEKVDVNKNTLFLHYFVYFTVLNKLGKRSPAVQNEAKPGGFVIVFHKSLLLPHHRHTLFCTPLLDVFPVPSRILTF